LADGKQCGKVTTTTWALGPHNRSHPGKLKNIYVNIYTRQLQLQMRLRYGYGYGYVQMSRVLNCINSFSFNEAQIEAAAEDAG